MKKHVIEISGVQKRFGQKRILSDVYLKIQTGEIIGILGRNGSGKSTLLKIICGLLSSSDKSVFVDGVSLNNSSNLFSEISYLCQDQIIPNHLSVERTVLLAVDKQKRSFFCEDVFVKSLLGKKVKNLSVGELRYLQVKIVLFGASKFALLDEPFSGLSPKMIEKIIELIQKNSEEKGILLTDHDYENVLKISTGLRLLKEGKLRVINNKAELFQNGYLNSPAVS
ncbi:ATP-binding cassette domain-containing protein [Flavobacterium notoginsengisoli]|uniref:ATP-binding cassette domain-containing protein n=1 Tax=Flavobacterium notoginsengisoli TaxID=1478199 RepID=UPI00362E35EA